MNEFYLNNSYIPFLDTAQIGQEYVYFRLAAKQEALNILGPPAKQQEALNILGPPAKQEALNILGPPAKQEALNILGPPAKQQEALNILPAPGGSGY